MQSRSLRHAAALAGVFAITALAAAAAWSQDKERIISERQELMKQQGHDWVVVRNYLQGKADEKDALEAVASLIKSVPTVPKYFPPGSEGPNPDGKWGPKPEVFSQPDKFLAADKKVAEQVAGVGGAIRSGDKAKAEAAFKDLDGCAACHQTFRAKLQ